ncbi:MAG: type I DNA topoisomerase [Pseudomonadales bacterium]|nr:type I DNA topoisomerase [Candidatus Woesebacteria bacterium]MCB9801958.1 type I DNA topoisomerase [Pseudomonadales bacterium]
MQLVIVESPTKAKKLSSYLGSEYEVVASVGHIRDLPKSGLSIDIEHDFEPTYEVSPGKTKVISSLKKAAKAADTVILATDPDREGEAIAWHVQHVIEEKTKVPFQRATFHEITKQAVLKALENPGVVNMDLVDAQQARRVVDRLVGYQVSPVLWKKVRRGLSAGRVQSVALRLIVEREREIEAFKPDEYWEVDVALSKEHLKIEVFADNKLPEGAPASVFVARVTTVDGTKFAPSTADDVAPLRSFLPSAIYSVSAVERKQRKRSAFPPFTTSTLQQAAATRLGFSSKQTMAVAQQLYEEGYITYHRTDSFNLSADSITAAREHIAAKYGSEYVPSKPNYYRSKSKNAQEAHEAIRSTSASLKSQEVVGAKITDRHRKLYDLIQRRYLASQMTPALYDQTSITIIATGDAAGVTSATLRSSGSILKFDGWMRLFPSGDDTLLPELAEGEALHFVQDNYAQKFTQPPARYNDASLVKELEKRGIGRPSTYASIISVILDRGYVERVQKRFFATPVGTTVSDFLLKHFPVFMEYEFTAQMEDDLDSIAVGEKQWRAVVGDFYIPFEKKVLAAEDIERVQIPVEKTGEICPECTEGEIVIRSGKYGKFKSCGRFPDCKYTQNIVEKLDDMSCPLCGEGEVHVKKSRWGKPFYGCSRYPKCDWAAWSKPDKEFTITKEEWDEEKKQREERKAARKGKWSKKGSKKTTAKTKAKTTKSKKVATKTKKTTSKKETAKSKKK